MKNGKIKAWLPAIRTGSGTDIFTQRLANGLEAHGIDTEISWFPHQLEPFPFLLKSVPVPNGTDVIFANSWNGFAFKRANIPLIVTVHHGGFAFPLSFQKNRAQNLYHKFLVRPFEIRSLKVADAVTAVSNFVADSLHAYAPPEKITVIHNWIDTERFSPRPSSSSNIHRPFRLLFAGKPSRLKGADLLAPIMRELGEDFELSITAKGGWKHDFPLPENTRMLGWLNETGMINAYQECDALIFPSRSEGFGYVALEAMACGKPVITSNGTALSEIIEHGVSGWCCQADDIKDFVQACRYLASKPNYAKEMGESARQRATRHFTEGRAISEYLSLIEKIL